MYAIYQDLTTSTAPNEYAKVQKESQLKNQSFQVKQVKVQRGDTVLSVIEKLHQNKEQLPIDRILYDFQQLNPNTDPYALKEGTFYYFPYYE